MGRISCAFNIDTACLELRFTDGSMIPALYQVKAHGRRGARFYGKDMESPRDSALFENC